MIRFAIFVLLALLIGTSLNTLSAQHSSKPTIPPTFIQNQGQWSPEVRFMAQVGGMNVWLTNKGLTYDVYQSKLRVSLPSDALSVQDVSAQIPARALRASLGSDTLRRRGHIIVMELVGANFGTTSIGTDAQPSTRNYFIGNNPDKWRTNVPTFGKVITHDVYPGIDAVYTFTNGKPRYDFVVHAGANPDDISLRFKGANSVRISKQNGVELSTSVGTVFNGNIYAYQEINGKDIPVLCNFAQHGDIVKFDLGMYDKQHPLIIDPLVYSTYYGGTGIEEITSMKLDTAGNVVVTGYTDSPNFRTVVGSYDTTANGQTDAFVAKFDKTLSKLLFATYIGGDSTDKANGVAIDFISGSIFIAGETTSTNMPTTSGAWKPAFSGGVDAYVARLNSDGSKLEYCTYVGGSKVDRALGICVDDAGKAAICGETNSIDFPTGGASSYQPASAGKYDAFFTQLRATGIGINFSTYLGGAEDDRANAIDCDRGGTLICFGGEAKGPFASMWPFIGPLTLPPYVIPYNDKFNAGSFSDGFVGKMANTGSFVEKNKHFLSYIGDTKNDRVLSVVLLPSGEVIAGGETEGGTGTKGFPVSNGTTQSNGGVDCFISKFNFQGTGLTNSYMFGGTGNEGVTGLFYNPPTTEIFAVGSTSSTNFPKATGGNVQAPEKENLGGVKDGFVCRLGANLDRLSYSTFFGGSSEDGISAVATTPRGDVLFAGYSLSNDVPVDKDGIQPLFGGSRDGFISKIAFGSVTITSPNSGAVFCPGSNVSVAWNKGDGLQSTENVNIELSSDGGATWTTVASNISGTTYSWKVPVSQASGSTYKVRILHPSSGIRDESDESFSIAKNAEITEQPVGDSVCVGSRVVIRIKVTGTNLTYKWLHNDVEIKGETRDSLVVNDVQVKNGGNYRVEVSAGCAPTKSQVAILTVKPETKVIDHPKNGMASTGDSFTFSVRATGNNLRYQWQQNKENIIGATDSLYKITSINNGNIGFYRVIVWGECGIDTSLEATIYPVGVIDLEELNNDFTIIPNPITDKFKIQVVNGSLQVYLYNTLGTLVTKQIIEGGKGEIDVSGLASGVYSVRLQIGTRVITKQVVVVR